VRVFLYVACVLDGECLASLTELQGLVDELGSATLENMRWTAGLLSRAATMWPLLPNIPRPLAELMSLGVGFIPVVGDLYDLVSGLTGYDPITGERLPEWARAVAIGAAFVPLVSSSNLRVPGKVMQWSDDVRLLFRTGIWGGTIRKIGRALPDGVTIGVRGRPVMAALWEGIYLRTGKFVPKPSLTEAAKVKWELFGKDFTSVPEFLGLRRMQDNLTGRRYFAHSDIDIQVITQNGVPMDPNRVKEFVDDLNASIGGSPLFTHGDIISGALGRAKGADLAYLQKQTILIGHGGSDIMENGLVFFNDEWRSVIEALMGQPKLK
jgi:hypothetical protein